MNRQRCHGFTLIEMVMTIVLLGILAGIMAPIIKNSVDAYTDTQSRTHLLDKVRLSLGRLSRELRQAAAPLINASGSTLEFVTTTVGGGYIHFNDNTPNIANADCTKKKNQVPSELQRFLPNEPIGTLCVLYPGNLAAFPAAKRDAFIINNTLVPVNSISAQVSGAPDDYDGSLWKIQFTSDETFSSESFSQTYSFADYRHRITLTGSNLQWERVSASASSYGSAITGILLNNVTAFTTSFNASKGVVSLSLTMTDGNENISASEDVYVRN